MDDRQSTEEQYWEERIRRMTQMSQDVSAGLHDDVLDPMREAIVTLITSQMPDGYAYDYNECRIVRCDPNLPDTFTIKSEAGNDLPVPAPRHHPPHRPPNRPRKVQNPNPTHEHAKPRNRPKATLMDSEPVSEEQYWEERIRRMTQMSQDVDDGLYDDVLIPLREATDRLITSQMPDGYAYDLDECRFVRFNSNLPDSFTIKGEAGNDLPVPAPAIIHPTALEDDPERYETRT